MTTFRVHLNSTVAAALLMCGGLGFHTAAAAGEYQLLLSARQDEAAGRDAFSIRYDTFDDLLNSPAAAPGLFSGINVSQDYVVGGLTYDGQYRLMLSARADQSAGRDVFMITYDTFDDLLNSPAAAPGLFSGINVSQDYVASGLTYDGQYRLMLSARADQGAGRDVFMITYDTFDDLLNSPAAAPGLFSGINVSQDYMGSALVFRPDPGSPVPEPGSLALALSALGLLAWPRRRAPMVC